MGTFLKWIAGIIALALAQLFADEFKEWMPSLVRKLVSLAVCGLPRDQRERYDEEWRSYVGDVPGQISKIITALGFCVAAVHLTWDVRGAAAPVQELQCEVDMPRGSAVIGSVLPTPESFGLLPEEKGRFGSFGVSLAVNSVIAVLILLFASWKF